jgi:hypothetical protein
MRKSNHVESVEEQISVAIRAAQIGLHAIHQKMGTAEQLRFTLQILELDGLQAGQSPLLN